MNIKILPLLSAGIILLSGCNRGADITQTNPDTAEIAEIHSDGTETAESSAFPDSPAGITAPDTPSSAPVIENNVGVSLTRDQYDYLREMTDFSGRYMSLEEINWQCVYIPEDTSRFGYAFTADDEWLYFQNIEYTEAGYAASNLTVTEYNILTGEFESFEFPTSYTISYADRDYFIYYDGEKDILVNHGSGESMPLPESEKLYASTYPGIKRIGQSFYYNISEEFSNADGSMSFESSVLCRYAPNVDYFAKLAADMEIVGSVSEEVYCKSSGGKIYRYVIGGGQAEFEFQSSYLHAGGAFAGYVIPTVNSSLFGQRYEVGRLLPRDTWNVYQQQIFTTHYGTRVWDIAITSESVAFVELSSNETQTVLAVDINSDRAADTGYSDILHCGRDWVYLRDYNDGGSSILAIKPNETYSLSAAVTPAR